MSKVYILQNKNGKTTHIYGYKKYKDYLKQGWKLLVTVWGWNMSLSHEQRGEE